MDEYLSDVVLQIRAGALRLAAMVLGNRLGLVEICLTDLGMNYSVKGINGVIPWIQPWEVPRELMGKRWMVDISVLVWFGLLIPEETFACETLVDNRKGCPEDPLPGEELEETLAWSKIPQIDVMFRKTCIEFHLVDSREVTILEYTVGGKMVEGLGKES